MNTITQEEKVMRISQLESHVSDVREALQSELIEAVEKEQKLYKEIRASYNEAQQSFSQQYAAIQKRIEELKILTRSPFFAKICYRHEGVLREIYIAKYNFSSHNICSWIAPIATLRFEYLGETTYRLHDGVENKVFLKEKENYTLSLEKLIYFSRETIPEGVHIVYEDFFSNKGKEFGLSEIISKIEKEQYQIIQSKAHIPLIVSGPAGSGKTTICLHRVAYLLQTPETQDTYETTKMLLFVQDISSKEYFASLLPKLDIHNMEVYTYTGWALHILSLTEYTEKIIGDMDEHNYHYLKAKHAVLATIYKQKINKNVDFLETLDRVYREKLNKKEYILFQKQKAHHSLDYIDVTIMLHSMTDGDAMQKKETSYKVTKTRKIKSYTRVSPILYGLILVDEFQNYDIHQLHVIQTILDKKTKSIMYVGDVNQKSAYFSTEKEKQSDYLTNAVSIHLSKVHRNTKQILSYIQSLGYEVEVYDSSREGDAVDVYTTYSQEETFLTIRDTLSKITKGNTIGILCDNEKLCRELRENIGNNDAIIMTKSASQGTEFHTVITLQKIVPLSVNDGEEKEGGSSDYTQENSVILRNREYVAYTRAVEKLIVIQQK